MNEFYENELRKLSLDIFGSELISYVTSKTYSDLGLWLLDTLNPDMLTDSIRILAGSESEDTEIARFYFIQCLNDLGIIEPKNENEKIQQFEEYVSHSVLSGEMDARKGLLKCTICGISNTKTSMLSLCI